MAEMKRWSGNVTSKISLYDDELDRFAAFTTKYEHIYIYGAGHVGQAMRTYMREAGLSCDGFVTSDTIDQILSIGSCGVVCGVSERFRSEIVETAKKYFKEEQIFILAVEKRDTIARAFDFDYVKNHFWLNIFVTNACNLLCRSCSTFSPVCHNAYYNVAAFHTDLQHIEKLHLPTLSVLKFTGGEALLHPHIDEFFALARDLFPQTPMECYTNGLLLQNMADEKMAHIAKNGIVMVVTEYPTERIDYAKVYRRLEDAQIAYEVIFSEGQKFFSKRPLNLKKDTPRHRFLHCPRYKMCDSLFCYEGRLYKCVYALSASYVNEAFPTNLSVTDGDYLSIKEIGIGEEDQIYRYCMQRLPFCGYCSSIEELVPWGLSTGDMSEWT